MKYAYTYSILRYRHDPLTGEAINVGVVVHSPKAQFLTAKVRKTVGRLTKVFPDADRSSVMETLRSVERRIDRASGETADFFSSDKTAVSYAKAALSDLDSCFVWSDLRSGLTSDPQSTALKLYERFVALYDEGRRDTRDDLAVWQPLRELLAERGVVDRLHEKVIVSAVDRVSFDNAWKNGAWHCYQPLSLDLATAEGIREKAARWSGHMTGLSKAAEKFRPYFFVGAPSDDDLREDYERALALLRVSACSPTVVEERDAASFADAIADEIFAHVDSPNGDHVLSIDGNA